MRRALSFWNTVLIHYFFFQLDPGITGNLNLIQLTGSLNANYGLLASAKPGSEAEIQAY